MTKEEYKAALDRCYCFDSREIGIWWNLEFMDRLEKEGLKLMPMSGSKTPPKDHYYQAPIPFPDGPIHWGPSWVVEQ